MARGTGSVANVAEAGRELHPDYGRPQPDGGAPCIRGLRVRVTTIIGMVADGMARQDIVAAYPGLTVEDIEDIEDSPRYAAQVEA
jgi:uncharacterized protein (DUF433 family)